MSQRVEIGSVVIFDYEKKSGLFRVTAEHLKRLWFTVGVFAEWFLEGTEISKKIRIA